MPRRSKRRGDRLGLIYAALTISTLAGISTWLDRDGMAITAAVRDKHERITVLHEPTGRWERRFEIGAAFQMPDGTPMQASVDVSHTRYDALRSGDPIQIRYLPALPILAQTTDRSTASIIRDQLARLATFPFLIWAAAGAVGLWVASRVGWVPVVAGGVAWVAAAFPLLFSTPPASPPRGAEGIARLEGLTLVTKSPARRGPRRHRGIRSRGSSDAVRRLAVPYHVVQLAVPLVDRGETVIAVDAVDSGSVPSLEIGASLPVQFDPAAQRGAQLIAGTREFRERNRYHFLPGVLVIGSVGMLAGLASRRRRTAAGAAEPGRDTASDGVGSGVSGIEARGLPLGAGRETAG